MFYMTCHLKMTKDKSKKRELDVLALKKLCKLTQIIAVPLLDLAQQLTSFLQKFSKIGICETKFLDSLESFI